MQGPNFRTAATRVQGAAAHPWFRWLAHYGLGLSGVGGSLPEARSRVGGTPADTGWAERRS